MLLCATPVQAQEPSADDFDVSLLWQPTEGQWACIDEDYTGYIASRAQIRLRYDRRAPEGVTSVTAHVRQVKAGSVPLEPSLPLAQNPDGNAEYGEDAPEMTPEGACSECGDPASAQASSNGLYSVYHRTSFDTHLLKNTPVGSPAYNITARIAVTYNYEDGTAQTFLLNKNLPIRVWNVTVDDLTNLGQGQTLAPDVAGPAVPYVIWQPPVTANYVSNPGSGPLTFVGRVKTPQTGTARLRFDIFSADNAETPLLSHTESITLLGQEQQGALLAPREVVRPWTWDGTYTRNFYDEWENWTQETVTAPRGLYQCRITVEVFGAGDGGYYGGYGGGYGGYEYGGYGYGGENEQPIADSDSTRTSRLRWSVTRWNYGYYWHHAFISPTYSQWNQPPGQATLKVDYSLWSLDTSPAHAVRAELFSRVYEGLEDVTSVAGPQNGPALTSFFYEPGYAGDEQETNTQSLPVDIQEKSTRPQVLLMTGQDRHELDRANRKKWGLSLSRKLTDNEVQLKVYRVVQPATETTPEVLAEVESADSVEGAASVAATGGKCYASLELEMAPHTKAKTAFVYLRLKEAPDTVHGITHSANEDHVDYMIYLNSLNFLGDNNPAQWEIFDESQQAWVTAEKAPAADDMPAYGHRTRWRARMPWNTTAKQENRANPIETIERSPLTRLLGHNGTHTLSLASILNHSGAINFGALEPDGFGMTFSAAPAPRSVQVKNLVVENITPEDALLLAPQPEEEEEPSQEFQVLLGDHEEGANYDLSLTIRQTLEPDTVIRTINRSVTGVGPHTISWDLKDDEGKFVAKFGGYFTFQLTAKKGQDTQTYRSTFLKTTQDALDIEVDANENILRDSVGRFHTIFKYKLNELPAPSSVAVRFYSNLTPLGVVGNLSQQNRWEATDPPVDIWLEATGEPSVRSVMSAKDNRAASYRDHLPKRMINSNQKNAAYRKYIGLTYCHPGAANWYSPLSRFGYLREMMRVTDRSGRPIDQLTGQVIENGGLGWRVENSWPANSGSPYHSGVEPGTAKMNSDRTEDQWSLHGPTPHSFTVKQNRGSWHFAYRLNPTARYDTTTSSIPDGFEWRQIDPIEPDDVSVYGSNGSKRRFTKIWNGRPIHYYRTWRYKILNEEGSDRHTPNDRDLVEPGETLWNGTTQDTDYNDGRYRQLLRIHEDGLKIGTDGCIGMRPGQMDKLWTRLDNIWQAMHAWHGNKASVYIPLNVYGPESTGLNAELNPPTDAQGWGASQWD